MLPKIPQINICVSDDMCVKYNKFKGNTVHIALGWQITLEKQVARGPVVIIVEIQ